MVVDQIRGIPRDPHLRAEVLEQAQAHVEHELTELQTNRRELARELARDHAEIKRLAIEGPANSTTTARIADLHERVAKAETQLAELTEHAKAIEGDRLGEDDIAAAFADFDNVWHLLSPREQAQVLALLIARVEFSAAESTVAVTFHPSAIKALAKRQSEEAA